MKKKGTPVPNDIGLWTRFDEDDPSFCQFVVRASCSDDFCSGYSMAEVFAGYRQVAGVLARLMACYVLEPVPGVSVTADAERMTDPCADTGDPPWLAFVVPPRGRKGFEAQLRARLNAILAADAWQPSPADEAQWADPDAVSDAIPAQRERTSA